MSMKSPEQISFVILIFIYIYLNILYKVYTYKYSYIQTHTPTVRLLFSLKFVKKYSLLCEKLQTMHKTEIFRNSDKIFYLLEHIILIKKFEYECINSVIILLLLNIL